MGWFDSKEVLKWRGLYHRAQAELALERSIRLQLEREVQIAAASKKPIDQYVHVRLSLAAELCKQGHNAKHALAEATIIYPVPA